MKISFESVVMYCVIIMLLYVADGISLYKISALLVVNEIYVCIRAYHSCKTQKLL